MNQDEPTQESVPERNLCAAILDRAIRDYLGGAASPEDRRDAEAWIFAKPNDPESPLDFVTVCSFLGYSPKVVRRYVKKKVTQNGNNQNQITT